VKIRFQADADLNEDIVAGILRREPRVDFRTAGEAGLRALDDIQALALAASDGRVLVAQVSPVRPAAFQGLCVGPVDGPNAVGTDLEKPQSVN
jgi:hypothetical protein